MLNKEEQDYVIKDYTRTDIDSMENDVRCIVGWQCMSLDEMEDAMRGLETLVGIVHRLMDIQDYPKDEVTE